MGRSRGGTRSLPHLPCLTTQIPVDPSPQREISKVTYLVNTRQHAEVAHNGFCRYLYAVMTIDMRHWLPGRHNDTCLCSWRDRTVETPIQSTTQGATQMQRSKRCPNYQLSSTLCSTNSRGNSKTTEQHACIDSLKKENNLIDQCLLYSERTKKYLVQGARLPRHQNLRSFSARGTSLLELKAAWSV